MSNLKIYLLPISQVFHTVVTVRIGLKTQLEWEHSFNKITYMDSKISK